MHNKRNAGLTAIGLALVVCLVLYTKIRSGGTPGTKPDMLNPGPIASLMPVSSPTSAVIGPTASSVSQTEQQSRFIAAFATPISFFGKVVDQHGSPVPLTDVKMAANDKAGGGKPSEYTLKSDADGLFTIAGITGLTLSVEVSKPGYRVIPPADGKVTSSGVFEYGLSSIRGRHQPHKANPVLFTLRKPGNLESLQKVGQRNFRMQRDGTPLAISLDQKGQHHLVLRCWNNDLQRAAGQRQYDWRFEAAVVNGGLILSDGVETEAPVEGYVTKDLLEMPSSLPPQEWRGFVERSYFIRFDDQTFARAKLEIHAAGDHFVAWESVFNSQPGSRNLEEPDASAR
jgi:hypothetical protein